MSTKYPIDFDPEEYRIINESKPLPRDSITLDDGIFNLKSKTFKLVKYNPYCFYKSFIDDRRKLKISSTGYSYEKYTLKSEKVCILIKIFETTFPVKSEREDFLKFCKSLLNGYSYDSLVVFLNKSVDNGVSFMIRLLKYLMGSYSTTFLRNSYGYDLLFGSYQPGKDLYYGPEYHLFELGRTKRVVWVSCPKVDSHIGYNYKFAHEDTSTFPTFIVTEVYDHNKNLINKDCKVFTFRSKFVENPNPENLYEYKCLNFYNMQISKLAPALFWYLNQLE